MAKHAILHQSCKHHTFKTIVLPQNNPLSLSFCIFIRTICKPFPSLKLQNPPDTLKICQVTRIRRKHINCQTAQPKLYRPSLASSPQNLYLCTVGTESPKQTTISSLADFADSTDFSA